MVIWLVGMSGAGKTTIGNKLYKESKKELSNIITIDGDDIRHIFAHNDKRQSYSVQARYENAKRIQNICLWLDQQDINVICSILCIFPEILNENKGIFSKYYEIFLDASLKELQQRDTKGLYAEASEGKIKNVVGLDIEFPVPENPNLHIKTDEDRSAEEITKYIYKRVSKHFTL